MDEETRHYIAAIERRLDDLRERQEEAVKLAHADMSKRLEGFPAAFATKDQMDAAEKTLQRLERDAIAREVYDEHRVVLTEAITRMDREKMPEATFQTFVENQRIKDDEAATERRAVASALAASTTHSGGVSEGKAAGWKQIGAIGGLVTLVMSTVIILSNQFLGSG